MIRTDRADNARGEEEGNTFMIFSAGHDRRQSRQAVGRGRENKKRTPRKQHAGQEVEVTESFKTEEERNLNATPPGNQESEAGIHGLKGKRHANDEYLFQKGEGAKRKQV